MKIVGGLCWICLTSLLVAPVLAQQLEESDGSSAASSQPAPEVGADSQPASLPGSAPASSLPEKTGAADSKVSSAKTVSPKSKQPAPGQSPDQEGGFSFAPLIGGLSGCAACGLPPDVVAVAGFTFFIMMIDEGAGSSPCAAVMALLLGVVFGLFPAMVATVVSGACAPCAVTGGASIGAGVAGRPFWIPMLGGLPGILIGLAGSTLIVVTAMQSQEEQKSEDTEGDSLVPETVPLLVGGAVAALLAGPIAAIGAIGADMLFGDNQASE